MNFEDEKLKKDKIRMIILYIIKKEKNIDYSNSIKNYKIRYIKIPNDSNFEKI